MNPSTRCEHPGTWVFLLFMCVPAVGPAADQEEPLWREPPRSEAPLLPEGTDPMPSLAGLVERLAPAVVHIYTTQVGVPQGPLPRPGTPFFEELLGGRDPFERFYGIPRGEFKMRALGSGFVIRADGSILTNHHVIAGAPDLRVKLDDQRSYPAEVVGSDVKTDIAVLKIRPRGRLPSVALGDSARLEPGDWVVAIGNPFGLGHSVSTGIISSRDGAIGHGPYDDFLQTDASIHPGNSGGPLVDAAGNVVGINTAIVSRGSRIGFAVPVDLVKRVVPRLVRDGKVRRGWLGVGVQDLSEELADSFGVRRRKGVLVSQVYPDSPAARARIKVGDIILAVEGNTIDATRDLSRRVADIPPGRRARISILRGGKQWTVRVTLAEREPPAGTPTDGVQQESGATHLGLGLVPLTIQWARRLGIDDALRGLVVREVEPGGATDGILKPGDVILEVNRTRVGDLAAFREALETSAASRVLLLVLRGSSQLFVVVGR